MNISRLRCSCRLGRGEGRTVCVSFITTTLGKPTASNCVRNAMEFARNAQESISPREKDALELIAAGESNKIIARRLDLSAHRETPRRQHPRQTQP
jgi:DNA-binding NarL/FixJ family response regulator